LQHANALAALRFVLVKPLNAIRVAFVTPRGEAEPDAQDYAAMLQLLSDYQPHSVQSLHDKAKASAQDSLAVSLETIKAMWAANVIAPAQAQTDIELVTARVQAFNRYVIQQSLYDDKLAWLASPMTGGAISLTRMDLLCLLSLQMGIDQPTAMLAFVRQVDARLTLDASDIAEFVQYRLPMFFALCPF